VRREIVLLRFSCWLGVVLDALSAVPLLFPRVGEAMLGLSGLSFDPQFLYVARIGASLMLGWTVLLAWAAQEPVGRKGIFLLTLVPVVLGLFLASVALAASGFVAVGRLVPLWTVNALVSALYTYAYILAGRVAQERRAIAHGDR
jgi:hypothetical protein